MLGQMQDWPLLVSKILEHGAINHGQREIVSLTAEGGKHRYNYAALGLRTKKLAQAMLRLGLEPSDRVGTLAWNTYRHVELWFGVAGIGSVCHTINPRLFPEQIVYIMNHAADKALFFDITFAPLVAKLRPLLTYVKHFVCMTDRAHMPADMEDVLCYEDLLDAEDGDYSWPTFDENTACGLCYTSGTTGNPKGVLYSNRSTFLHTAFCIAGDTLGIGACSSVLPVVPMFHANAWGFPYAATISGAKLVLNGPHHDAPTLHKLMLDEDVTITGAVPTIWLAMMRHLKENDLDCGKLEAVTIGGAAVPSMMIEAFQNDYGVRVNHAWGMTETSPLGTLGSANGLVMDMDAQERLRLQTKQGRVVPGLEMTIKDSDGNELPRDGKTSGHLMVRGPWVVDSYYGGEGGQILDDEGWFDTGDVANIDEFGYMQITDRSKDVIKSGGEWISSIDLENAAVSHPWVTEAAVIGVPHPKWNERPLLIVTLEDGKSLTFDEMKAHLTGKIASWWMPDALEVVTEIPHTATGKISKKDLRAQFEGYTLPGL